MAINRNWVVCFVIGTAFAGEIGMVLFGGSALAGFALIRILFGFSEGPTFSTINKTNANWATPKERGFAVSLGLLGTPLGALLTAPVAVALLSITSWKVMFLLLGVLGVIWVILWRKMFTNLPEEHPKVSKEELEQIGSTKDLLPGELLISVNGGKIKWSISLKIRI